MYHDNICCERVVLYTNAIIVVITVLIIEGKISFLFWCILNWAPTRPNKEECVGCDNKVTNICLVKNWLKGWIVVCIIKSYEIRYNNTWD